MSILKSPCNIKTKRAPTKTYLILSQVGKLFGRVLLYGYDCRHLFLPKL